MAFAPTPRQLGAIKAVLFALALLPFARLVYLTVTQQFVEPLEAITRGTGDWVLYLLCITLAITPAAPAYRLELGGQIAPHGRSVRVFLRLPALPGLFVVRPFL